MNYITFERVLLINKHFYDTVGSAFNNTRQTTWKAFADIIKSVLSLHREPLNILDIGCGNGRFISELNNQKVDYNYLGIDNNDYLIQYAKIKYQNDHTRFKKLDIVNNFIQIKSKFDLVVCFGVTHHLPSAEFRFKFFEDVVEVLDQNGIFVVSFFDFLEDPRFESKILDDEKILKIANSLSAEKIASLDLEEHDYFLGWSNEKVARYCHYYSIKEKNEIVEYLKELGVILQTRIYSDGNSDKYNSYYIFKKGV